MTMPPDIPLEDTLEFWEKTLIEIIERVSGSDGKKQVVGAGVSDSGARLKRGIDGNPRELV